jgi:hypothetical protein
MIPTRTAKNTITAANEIPAFAPVERLLDVEAVGFRLGAELREKAEKLELRALVDFDDIEDVASCVMIRTSVLCQRTITPYALAPCEESKYKVVRVDEPLASTVKV